MNSYDKALEHLNQATQRTFEPSMELIDRDRCWRCLGKPGSGPSGVCDRCREVLLAGLPPSEPETAAIPADFDFGAASAAISAVRTALQAHLDQVWEQLAAGWANSVESPGESPENGPEPELGVVLGPQRSWFTLDDEFSGNSSPPDVEYPAIGPHFAWIGTRYAESDLYEQILRGPIITLPPEETP